MMMISKERLRSDLLSLANKQPSHPTKKSKCKSKKGIETAFDNVRPAPPPYQPKEKRKLKKKKKKMPTTPYAQPNQYHAQQLTHSPPVPAGENPALHPAAFARL
jgi:hypothetical protein